MKGFERIIESVKAIGVDARETAYTAGLYYDGQQHGELIPCVRVSIDRMITPNADKIAREARKAVGRFRGCTVIDESYICHIIYTVMRKEDADRIPALKEEAKTFSDAFNLEIHRQHTEGETVNGGRAVKAGIDALVKAGYRKAEQAA